MSTPLIAAETLATGRLVLRRPELSDFDAFAAYTMSERTLYIGGPKSRRLAFDKLANFAGHWLLRGYGRYTITEKATGRAIGHVGAFCHDASLPPALAWTLWDGAAEGKGYAREAAAETLRHYRDDLGWTELVAYVHEDNDGSIAIARALGGGLSPEPGREPLSLRFDFDLREKAA